MPLEHCKHVYRDLKANPCPLCGGDTHTIDWNLLREQRNKHREEKGLFYTVKEWWSI